jgi:hypothetical protein
MPFHVRTVDCQVIHMFSGNVWPKLLVSGNFGKVVVHL